MALSVSLFAQTNDPVVMKINGKEIKKSEFDYIYNKNNTEEAIDKRSLDDYIVLFTNFKLRVAEAEAQGLDTTAAFHKELNEYRTQLAKPYLKDLAVDENQLQQAYDRSQDLAEVSVIFLAFPSIEKGGSFNLLPADTLEMYNKAVEIRNKALKKGADFDALVKEYSSDERTKQGDRPGYIGWVSGLYMAFPMEKAIYNTPVGKITDPVLTNQGYCLFKVLNKKPEPGRIHAAHILLMTSKEADTVQIFDTQAKLDEIYAKLNAGEDFGELAKEYSDDKGSAQRGGDLSWFKYGDMVPEFNDAVFAMTDTGSISRPVKTQYGYHIIKLLDKQSRVSLDEVRGQLETKFDKTGNYLLLHQPGINELKAENNYSLNAKAYQSLAEAANTLYPTDSAYIAKFADNKETLFSVNNQPVSIGDFVQYLQNNPKSYQNFSPEFLQDRFDQLVYQKLTEAENATLENKYPEFRNLMREYRDGILLFEVSNREVWEKASNDTVGLSKFFEANKPNYTWTDPHWKGYVVLAKDAETKKKMLKDIKKLTPDEAVKFLLDNYKVGDVSYVRIEKGLFTKGQNKFVDEQVFKTGKAELPDNYQDYFVLGKLLPTTPETYTDVRGLVVTDYQDYLEKEWLKKLNEKYPVVIYRDVLK
ncbi:peptidyl-prolyl cis-trans isomerase [Bacteroidia bacterium]|nr:peptidyl-prolyl cis-trans isomerase [Bacteroidia bacterium]